MDNDIYEVDRDDYVGFLGQLNKEKCHVEVSELDDMTTIKISSKTSGTHFCTRIIQKDGEEHYFVFHMPAKNERIQSKPIMKVTLDTKEEVQDFFNALGKAMAGGKDDDGNL